jgi:hypothetical protein
MAGKRFSRRELGHVPWTAKATAVTGADKSLGRRKMKFAREPNLSWLRNVKVVLPYAFSRKMMVEAPS